MEVVDAGVVCWWTSFDCCRSLRTGKSARPLWDAEEAKNALHTHFFKSLVKIPSWLMIFSAVPVFSRHAFQKDSRRKFSLALIEAIYFILTKDEVKCKWKSSCWGFLFAELELISVFRASRLCFSKTLTPVGKKRSPLMCHITFCLFLLARIIKTYFTFFSIAPDFFFRKRLMMFLFYDSFECKFMFTRNVLHIRKIYEFQLWYYLILFSTSSISPASSVHP